MVIASGETVYEALQDATKEAVDYMAKGLGISWEDAYVMSSLTTDLKVSQVVDPKMTVRAAIPKYVLATENLLDAL